MIVRNWMTKDPQLVSSDTLVVDVKRLLHEKNLRAVLVVDDGRLRGIITRVICLRAAENVMRSEDPHELDYFALHLMAKDLMIRNPRTINTSDTMEHCLRWGQDVGISQFPVLEDGKVVGLISASEIFHLAARILGAWESWGSVTLAPAKMERGTIAAVSQIVETAGATVESIFSFDDDGEKSKRKIVIRFQGEELDKVTAALGKAGYELLESYASVQGQGTPAELPYSSAENGKAGHS